MKYLKYIIMKTINIKGYVTSFDKKKIYFRIIDIEHIEKLNSLYNKYDSKHTFVKNDIIKVLINKNTKIEGDLIKLDNLISNELLINLYIRPFSFKNEKNELIEGYSFISNRILIY